MRIAWEHQRGEVGYWLAAPARGHGHTTRAVRMICAWGFAQLGLERISLLAATANQSSQAVARRSGFTYEAVLRSYATYGGRRSTWPASRCWPADNHPGEASETSRHPWAVSISSTDSIAAV